MSNTYSKFSDVCTKFYDLVLEPQGVADFVYAKIETYQPKNCLFVGGFFLVARELEKLGLNIVLTDYSQDMIEEARKRLPNTRAEVADLRELPFCSEFDAVLVIGRVFTHMLSPEDASKALKSVHRALKPGGITLLDNYEDSKIQCTDYFNGRVAVKDADLEIIRDSTTELISEQPFVVNWSARYQASSEHGSTEFSDEMKHRAFSRMEMAELFEKHGFCVEAQGDNFDETSFYTLGKVN